MIIDIIKPYTDRVDGSVHMDGETLEVTDERGAELVAKGHAVAAEVEPEGVTEDESGTEDEGEPEDGDAETEDEPEGGEEKPTAESSREEIIAYLKAHGIKYNAKSNRETLVSLIG